MDYKSIMLGEKTPALKILMLYDSSDTTSQNDKIIDI